MTTNERKNPTPNRLGLGAIGIAGASVIAFSGIVAVTAQNPSPTGTSTPRTGTATPATGTPGATSSAREQLIADLSSLLTEHVYQAGAIGFAIKDDDSQRLQRLQRAAVENSADLNQAIRALATSAGGSGSGAARTPTAALPSPSATVPGANPRGTDFASLWNLHLAYLIDYANAINDGKDTEKQKARENLNSWSTQFAAHLAGQVNGLNEQAVQQALRTHVTSLTDLMDAIEKDDAQVDEMMRKDAQHLAQLAGALGGAAR